MKITDLEAINSTIESCTAFVSREGIMFSFPSPGEEHSSTMFMCKFDNDGNVNVDDLMQAKLDGAESSIRFQQSSG